MPYASVALGESKVIMGNKNHFASLKAFTLEALHLASELAEVLVLVQESGQV